MGDLDCNHSSKRKRDIKAEKSSRPSKQSKTTDTARYFSIDEESKSIKPEQPVQVEERMFNLEDFIEKEESECAGIEINRVKVTVAFAKFGQLKLHTLFYESDDEGDEDIKKQNEEFRKIASAEDVRFRVEGDYVKVDDTGARREGVEGIDLSVISNKTKISADKKTVIFTFRGFRIPDADAANFKCIQNPISQVVLAKGCFNPVDPKGDLGSTPVEQPDFYEADERLDKYYINPHTRIAFKISNVQFFGRKIANFPALSSSKTKIAVPVDLENRRVVRNEDDEYHPDDESDSEPQIDS